MYDNYDKKDNGSYDKVMHEDFHTHSSISDGRDAPQRLVEAAIGRGLTALGISDHGYAAYDTDCCMKRSAFPAYLDEISRLKELYRGRIELYCGIEQDIFSSASTAGCDYVIGSVHYVRIGDDYFSVDWKEEHLRQAARLLDGDIYTVIETYFDSVALVCDVTGCDIIGHFDLISKLNERSLLFDTQHPRYIAAWQSAADKLLGCGKPFEINTGAMSRGYRSEPYPAADITRYLAERGARFVLSSDSHASDFLCYGFEQCAAAARDNGLQLISFADILRDRTHRTEAE